MILHGKADQRITLIDVSFVPGLGFNLYSLHTVQRTHLVVSDASGTHIIGDNLTFPRSSSGSYLRATRLLAGTVRARRRQGDIRATNLLQQLRHPIPPPPKNPPPAETCARLVCIIQIVKLRFHNRFIYVGVDISIHALLTGGPS